MGCSKPYTNMKKSVDCHGIVFLCFVNIASGKFIATYLPAGWEIPPNGGFSSVREVSLQSSCRMTRSQVQGLLDNLEWAEPRGSVRVNNLVGSWWRVNLPSPNILPPQERSSLYKGLLTIGFPVSKPEEVVLFKILSRYDWMMMSRGGWMRALKF